MDDKEFIGYSYDGTRALEVYKLNQRATHRILEVPALKDRKWALGYVLEDGTEVYDTPIYRFNDDIYRQPLFETHDLLLINGQYGHKVINGVYPTAAEAEEASLPAIF